MWLPRKCDYRRDGRTDRRRTKWSLCAAMLCRRHKKWKVYGYCLVICWVSSTDHINDVLCSLVRFWPKVQPVFISLITKVSFLLANWLKMHKMRCIRQVNKNYFPFFHNFIENTILAFWGVCWTEKSRNINENERWYKTTLNNSYISYGMH